MILGQFTLRDMYEQFQNIMKMGPFNQIMVQPLCYIHYHIGMLTHRACCRGLDLIFYQKVTRESRWHD